MAIVMKISFILAGLTLLASCQDKNKRFDASKAETGSAQSSGTSADSAVPPDPMATVIPVMTDNRPIEQVLCEEGPKVIGSAKKADFSEQFNMICEGTHTTALFKESVVNAYQGTGEPMLKLVNYSSDANFVTTISIIYTIKVPLDSPSDFSSRNPHGIFQTGIKPPNSELFITLDGEPKAFPNERLNVQQLKLNYDMTLASGASIYDKRHTEFNTYLLVEKNKDIAVSTEHLLDVEANEYYHKAQGLTIGLKAENGQSYLVFVSTLVVKNRIQPERIRDTLVSLNTEVAKMLHKHIATPPGK